MKLVIGIATLVALAATALFTTGVTAQQQVDVAIDELNGSGVTGSATVSDAGNGSTDITINVSGLAADSSHVNHIHDGTGCGEGEYSGIVQELSPVVADAAGDGTGSTTVAIDYNTITDGNHVLIIHAGASLAEDPMPIACGHIPVTSIIAPPAAGTGYLPGDDNTAYVLAVGAAAAGLALVGAGWTLRRRTIRA